MVKLPNSGGMLPLSWLLYRSSHSKLVRLPNSGGMQPLSWLLSRLRDSKLARLPNSVGMLPIRWLPHRWRPVTCSPLHVTRDQLHGVFVSNQPLLSLQLAPSVLL